MAVFGKHLQLGFWLTDTALDAAVIQPRRKGWKVIGEASVPGDGLLQSDGRRQRLTSAFQQAAKGLPRVARRADMPAFLAVPDAMVEEEVLSFAEFPSARREAKTLVAQRMARELGTVADDLSIAWETFSSSTGEVTCRTRAMSRALEEDIEAGASAAGLRLVRVDGWSGFASGAPELGTEPFGAAVWSDGAEWSLLCWRGDDPAGYFQSGQAADLNDLSDTVARLSASYAKGHDEEAGKLFVAAPADAIRQIKASASRLGLSVFEFAAGDNRAAQVAAWA